MCACVHLRCICEMSKSYGSTSRRCSLNLIMVLCPLLVDVVYLSSLNLESFLHVAYHESPQLQSVKGKNV